MVVSLSFRVLDASGRPGTHFTALWSCHDPSILYEARDDWVPGVWIARLADGLPLQREYRNCSRDFARAGRTPMPQRLTPLEVSLLALDTAHTPGHVGTVHIFDPGPDGFEYERLIALIRERLAFVPRYRQRVRGIPARLAGGNRIGNGRLTFREMGREGADFTDSDGI
jgi:hypothetical protein